VSIEELDDQQRVLSEASHDLANRFHRSYYFLELLGEAIGPDNDSAESLLTRLRETVEDIESISRSTLDFIRPLELRTLRVRMDDLVASLRQHVGLRPVELGGDTEAGRSEVEVDPARISEALAILCRTVVGDDDTQSPVIVELIGGDPVGLCIRGAAKALGATHADIALALTARIARLHGGALDIGGGDSLSMTLRLPVAGRRA